MSYKIMVIMKAIYSSRKISILHDLQKGSKFP